MFESRALLRVITAPRARHAAADDDPLSMSCPMPKAKNIYSTLIDKKKLSVGGYA